MSGLEHPREANTAVDAENFASVDIDGDATSVPIPADASGDEAAALAVAIGAHLTDRRRAAAVAAADRRRPVDRWRLADRLDVEDADRWLDAEEGEEWRVAGRQY